jgi:peptide/nickel transport system substrate-binding protein
MVRAIALTAAIVASLLAVSGAGGAPAQTPKRGGTVVAAGVDPGCLNVVLFESRHVCGAGPSEPTLVSILNQVFAGAYAPAPDSTYRLNLIRGVRLTHAPLVVTYLIRPEAKWSDGTPVTARDFVFTFNAFAATPLYQEARIRRVEAVDAKIVRMVFRSDFAGWHDLFHWVLPQHALAGENLESVWKDAIDNPKTGAPLGSGPFLVQRYERGDQIVLRRNGRYWGRHTAYLDRVVFRLGSNDPGAQVAALRDGNVDMINLQVQPELAALRGESGISVRSGGSSFWETMAIRLVDKGNPLLSKRFVRRALAFGIDRVALVRQLFRTISPSLRPLQSGVFLTNSRFYRPNWQKYSYQPAHAHRLLEKGGCHRGNDSVYACAGERLSFRLATTAGNRFRELTLKLVQAQLLRAGVEVVPTYVPPLALFDQMLPSGDFDLALIAFGSGTPDPRRAVLLWSCGGRDNAFGYCNRPVSHDLHASNRVFGQSARAALLNRADAQIADDVPALPLYQKPTFRAFKSAIRNVIDDPFGDTTSNAENWWLAK